MWTVSAVASFVALAGCDPAEFRPAKSFADNLPPEKDAFRAHREDVVECPQIGVVHTEGNHGNVYDIAKTVARHGGTHYVVRGDFREDAYDTYGTASHVGGGMFVGRSRTEVDHMRKVWAEVYRCK